jgi:hypothetical protein
MYYTTQHNPGAWIVDSRDRGRKKIYLNGKVYLPNNQEFLIELFNPLQESILAEIKINGKNASSNGLVLRPGERHYLDCFVDDKRKFVFKTYEIENSSESLNATANNGLVEVSFYKEKTNNYNYSNYNYYNQNGYYPTVTYPTNLSITYTSNIINDTDSLISNSSYSNKNDFNKFQPKTTSCYYSGTHFDNANSINKRTLSSDKTETGRIERGDKSNQKFESVNMDFESYSINKITYQILPESKKPIETKELKNNFCTSCGFKNKDYKFCPNCGEKI